MIISLTISPNSVPITKHQVERLPVTPDRVLKGVVSYVGYMDEDDDPMRFLSEFVNLRPIYEEIFGTYLAYVEITDGTCYLAPMDLVQLGNFNAMLGINIKDENLEASQSEDSDDGDELRWEDDHVEPPQED